MVEPAFLAVTRTPSSVPCGEVTCPDRPSARTAPGPVNSATARPTAVESNRCSLRISISPMVDNRICRDRARGPCPGVHGGDAEIQFLPVCAIFLRLSIGLRPDLRGNLDPAARMTGSRADRCSRRAMAAPQRRQGLPKYLRFG